MYSQPYVGLLDPEGSTAHTAPPSGTFPAAYYPVADYHELAVPSFASDISALTEAPSCVSAPVPTHDPLSSNVNRQAKLSNDDRNIVPPLPTTSRKKPNKKKRKCTNVAQLKVLNGTCTRNPTRERDDIKALRMSARSVAICSQTTPSLPRIERRRDAQCCLDDAIQGPGGCHLAQLAVTLYQLVEPVTASAESYSSRDAVLFINALQTMLQFHPSLEGSQKGNVVQALICLSKRTKHLPDAYAFEGVIVGDVIHQRPNVDIFRGTYRGRSVCLKRHRIVRQSVQENDRNVKMMLEEAIVWYNYRHPNILPCMGIYQPDGKLETTYLVSPFLDFETAPEYLSTHPDASRCLLLSDVAAGLSYLHGNNIVHGDIKGCNVLVNSSGRACLADLGMSKITDEGIVDWTSIRTMGPTGGTLHWMAPEHLHAWSQDEILGPTTSSDMYSFGCLMYEVFTGRIPFKDINGPFRFVTEIVESGRRPQKPTLDDPAHTQFGLSEEIWMVMEACWDRDPERRPSIRTLADAPFLTSLADDGVVRSIDSDDWHG